MYKIVFIDDEVFILEGMKKYIDWESYGFIVSGEAEDGIKGVELCKRLIPDVVITDIRMPGKDGIELIEELKDELKNTKFIILSGFGEFELAQKAVRLGACDYILKPINKEQLICTITKIKNSLDKSLLESEKNKRISDVVSKNSNILKNKLLENIVNDNVRAIQTEVEYFNITGPNYSILCFEYDSSAEKPQSGDIEIVFNIIASFIEKNKLEWHIGQYQYSNLIFCSIKDPSIENIKKVVELLVADFFEKTGIRIFVGIGGIVSDLKDVSLSFQTSLENLESRFYDNTGNIFLTKPDYVFDDLQKKYLSVENELSMASALENGDQHKFETLFFSLLEGINLAGYHSPKDIKIFFENFVTKVLTRINSPDGIKTNLNQILEHIHLQKSYKSVIEYVKDILSKTCALHCKDDKYDSKKIIKEIKRYIQENISDEITLNTIALRFHMNLFYISHLFKKETEMNFLDYLTSLRVEKAKDLLKDVNNKIYEVALKVGYDDQRYFSQVFKKYTGYTPKEYRDLRG